MWQHLLQGDVLRKMVGDWSDTVAAQEVRGNGAVGMRRRGMAMRLQFRLRVSPGSDLHASAFCRLRLP
jgi:hypothetical protein